jgi:light-regulated signal transduction histidine kinase (bacteriophytochrome)
MTLETLHRRKDRSLCPVEVNLSKLASDGEEFFVSIALDITERVNHIRAIEEQNRILKDIAWMQSHMVRAPLSRMMMLLTLLENKDKNPKSIPRKRRGTNPCKATKHGFLRILAD